MRRLARGLIALALLASPVYALKGFTELESVTTSAGEEIGSSAGRLELTIINTDATNYVCCSYLSTVTCSGGTNTDGQRIAAGAGYTWDARRESVGSETIASNPIYCRANGGTVSVTYDEVRK